MPRERFVPDAYAGLAYADCEPPLGKGQVMLSPKVVGRLLQALAVQPGDPGAWRSGQAGASKPCRRHLGHGSPGCTAKAGKKPSDHLGGQHDLTLAEGRLAVGVGQPDVGVRHEALARHVLQGTQGAVVEDPPRGGPVGESC